MATTTTKLALTKPDGTDLVDIAVLNANADKIDAASGATICTSSTRPASPWNGQVIFETDTLNALVYRTSTTSWNILGGSTVASDPPAGAGNGNFWWDSDNGKLYIYYNDGNSGQWVSVMPATTAVDVSQNAIINGGFDIWQRGTATFTTALGYTADRWNVVANVTSPTATRATNASETGLPESIGQYVSIGGTNDASIGYHYFQQFIEDVKTFAGQTVTVSFYAKGSTAGTIATTMTQRFGTSGSADVFVSSSQGTVGSSHAITTSWQRYSVQYTLPSVSGKTINAADSLLQLRFVRLLGTSYSPASGYGAPTAINFTGVLHITGVQVEKGSVPTSFKRAAGTIQGELAACQRYYYRSTARGANAPFAIGQAQNATVARYHFNLPVPMRALPTAIDYSGPFQENSLSLADSLYNVTGINIESNWYSDKTVYLSVNTSGQTAGKLLNLSAYNSASAYIGISSEL